MQPIHLILCYSIGIVSSSLAGGWIATRYRFTHVAMQSVLSFVGGFMLGIGLLHMIPHGVASYSAVDPAGAVDKVASWTLIGLLFTFGLIRTLHFHQHGTVDEPTCDHADEHADEHAHGHHHDYDPGHSGTHQLSWTGVVIGLSIHTLMDGVALGAAVQAAYAHAPELPLWGFGVFIAVMLHKPLDALSVTSVMIAGGWSQRACHLVNLGFATMCPIGALLVVLGMNQAGQPQMFLGLAQAFAAGAFLCISLSDLLPEVQFHRHDRFKLSVSLVLGVACAYGMRFLEGH